MPHKVFWLEPTDKERVWLRRYRSRTVTDNDGGVIERPGCPLPWGYHDAMRLVRDRLYSQRALGDREDPDRPSDDSPLWPTHCTCGYAFQEDDERQVFHGRLYRGAPDGLLYTLRDAPPGAMWNAEWAPEWMRGPDGIALMVKLPNGHDWAVDSEASNCTRPQWQPVKDDQGRDARRWLGRTHYCWIRHGDPMTGNVHVDKNGNTCAAGAGSILSGSYHGFLHHGFLTDG